MSFVASLRQSNISLFRSMNSVIGRSEVLDAVIRYFAEFHIALIVASVAYFLGGNFGPFGTMTAAALDFYALILTVCFSFLVVETIRHFHPRPRPFVELGTPQLFSVIKSSTFPSAHTIFIFSLGTAVCFYNAPAAYVLALFIFLSGIVVGIARVMAGVHYPLDIFSGATFGVIVGILTGYFCRYFF